MERGVTRLPTINELVEEYKCQVEQLDKDIARLKKKAKFCTGQNLYNVRCQIANKEAMKDDCIATYMQLKHNYM
jgi:hypothetical protein